MGLALVGEVVVSSSNRKKCIKRPVIAMIVVLAEKNSLFLPFKYFNFKIKNELRFFLKIFPCRKAFIYIEKKIYIKFIKIDKRTK